MRILVVAATDVEIAPLVARLHFTSENGVARIKQYSHAGHAVDVLTTGVGMVATAAWCSRAFAQTSYGLALNAGVCGSFDRALEPGASVHVVSDRIADLGAEDGGAFLTVQELHLLGENDFPFTGGQLLNASPPANETLGALPSVSGVTVNTVHGADGSIAAIVKRFNPQVESMEGAAFMYACLVQGLPFIQLRAVSNFVERRNRAGWRMSEAIDTLGHAALKILDHA
jgi:futalosine hydrolase